MTTRAEKIASIRALADRHERLIARGFIQSVERIRDLVALDAIQAAFEQGPEAVARLFSEEALRAAQAPLEQAISNAALDGARNAAAMQDPVVNSRGVVAEFVFNAGNPRLASFIDRTSATRIREVGDSVKQGIRLIVRDQTTAGVNPRQAARQIRETIGLTAAQRRAVSNYEAMLRSIHTRDAETLAQTLLRDGERKLRDRRFDRALVGAARREQPLSEEQIAKMVARYNQRYIDYRAVTIGRTEAIRSLNGAAHEYMGEQVRQEKVDRRQVRRFWEHTRDDRTRVDHTKIPGMNEDGRGLNEPFVTPTGERLMYPGDLGGSPGNVINCRCVVFHRIVPFELIGSEAE